MVVFAESALRHGYEEEDFFEVLELSPLKLRSRRGLKNVYELYERNFAGEYLHIAYRREAERDVVFHIRAMSRRERHGLRKIQFSSWCAAIGISSCIIRRPNSTPCGSCAYCP